MLELSHLGEQLRRLRARAHLSQREVEKATGISKSTLHYLENGLHWPQGRTLRRLLTLYSIRIRTLEQKKMDWGSPGTTTTTTTTTTLGIDWRERRERPRRSKLVCGMLAHSPR